MAAALLSGQAFAGNSYANATKIAAGKNARYAGVSGTPVVITESASGEGVATDRVYGVYDGTNNVDTKADGGKVIMNGGAVNMIYGSYTNGTASNNVVVMNGGTVDYIYGAYGLRGATDNSVIITGGTVTKSLFCAYSSQGTENSHIYIIGNDAKATIGGTTYEHTGDITLGAVWGETSANPYTYIGENRMIDIYGSGIEATAVTNCDVLNFHLANNGETVLTLSNASTSLAFDLTNVEISFDTVENFSVGSTITLVESQQAITLSQEQLKTKYFITDSEGIEKVGTLTLSDDKKTLKMTITPEPATATLSLLALAGLAARRRRH